MPPRPPVEAAITRVSPALLRMVAAANAVRSPMLPHHSRAIRARGYAELLTAGELWFLNALLKITTLSDKQDARLREIEFKVERTRP